jgi:hypothetical protein
MYGAIRLKLQSAGIGLATVMLKFKIQTLTFALRSFDILAP